jgi:hypothetical protein
MDGDKIVVDDRALTLAAIAATHDPARRDWIRTALVFGVPLGALLREANAADIADLHMLIETPEWEAAHANAVALTSHAWRIGETHEIAIRHLWGLWVPEDMHTWRVFRCMRAAKQVEADYGL